MLISVRCTGRGNSGFTAVKVFFKRNFLVSFPGLSCVILERDVSQEILQSAAQFEKGEFVSF